MDELRPAFQSYQGVDPAAEEAEGLNLAWTRDERECLSVDLTALLKDELRAEIADDHPWLDRYLVRDPYGEQALGLPVTCGAGVVSLLACLARLSPKVRILGETYPDFPYWLAQSGGSCAPDADLWFLERPSLTGDAHADLAPLADEAARADKVVIVDESNANYCPPGWSAASLARDNVIVVRGFSKAYGLGGLRLAYCVASPRLTARIRTVVPPLLVSSLSLRLGARVLALGDITAPLRARIAAHKAEMIALLRRAGVASFPSSEHLPYVFARASEPLRARGIVGKQHSVWSAGAVTSLYRLSVPLNESRMERLRGLLTS